FKAKKTGFLFFLKLKGSTKKKQKNKKKKEGRRGAGRPQIRRYKTFIFFSAVLPVFSIKIKLTVLFGVKNEVNCPPHITAYLLRQICGLGKKDLGKGKKKGREKKRRKFIRCLIQL
ncbi:hypothetical protein, partial [Pedobacter suwonensis]